MAKTTLAISLLFAITLIAGCGGGSGSSSTPGAPLDPSGNWSMKLTDANSNNLLLSALFDQQGSTVTAFSILAVGNANLSCVPFSATLANGTVQNVNQFSGDINTQNFGSIHFASTLNPQASQAQGTYTLTGSCWGVASSGTFTADEIPSVSGTWTGTVTCVSNCPTGSTTGTISATVTQNDSTGVVTGTYTVSGLPNISNGTIGTSTDLISGHSWQSTMIDQITQPGSSPNRFVLTGGPAFPANTAGIGQDRSFIGNITEINDSNPIVTALAAYTVTMTH
jgi:hypothetical protein